MNPELKETGGVRLAIEGCGHGTLHAIYASVTEACKRKGWPDVDLLIIGGDFQAVRNAYDLNCVSMPAKYRSMCDFHEYYSGQRKAPYLTIFVGGNHEASNYLFELYYGGWVVPNIYYMGAANVLRFGPLRIAGMSGIWKGYNYRKPHFERLPYNESDMKSIYHVRELDVRKLLQVRSQVDIGISHDWPKGVEWKGNWKQLFNFKKHLEEDAKNGQLGSVAAQHALDWLRPRWWFSAHLHCKYAAIVNHEADGASNSGHIADTMQTKNGDEIDLDDHMSTPNGLPAASASSNTNEIDLDLDEEPEPSSLTSQAQRTNADEVELDLGADVEEAVTNTNGIDADAEPNLDAARASLPEAFRRPPAVTKPPEPVVERPTGISNTTTNFLALDKCLPGKHFLQLMEIPLDSSAESTRPFKLEYDREWLAITRAFAIGHPLTLGDPAAEVPKSLKPAEYAELIDKRRLWIDENIKDADLIIPQNFEMTAPVYDNGNWNLPQYSQVREYPNPQTVRFCKMLEIPNPFEISEDDIKKRLLLGPRDDPFEGRHDQGQKRGGFGRGRGGGRGRGMDRGRGGRGRGRFTGR